MQPTHRAASCLRALFAAAFAVAITLAPGPARAAEVQYVATIHPLGMILRELCVGRADVEVLIPSAASPHTYDPKPSDARKAAAATALFFVSEGLDGWASELEAGRRVQSLSAVPTDMLLELDAHGHSHGEGSDDAHAVDAHFWLDPLAVKAALPSFTAKLSEIDPGGTETYSANAKRFAGELDELHSELTRQLAPVAGEALLMFHPAFGYLAERYSLRVVGAIEPFPGREPSPKYIAELIERIEAENVKALFTEPQLPPKPAEALAEATGIPLFMLDPNGGSGERATYAGLIKFNSAVLADALAD